MKKYAIDINCDVGEGFENEGALFPFISSCNIACGAHAGDSETMTTVVQLAKTHNIKIGAHPAYPDRENFGRISLKIPEEELIYSIKKQLDDLHRILTVAKVSMHHIKAHGALYNDIAKDSTLATLFLKAITPYKNKVHLYVPYRSAIAHIARQQGFTLQFEAFGDRNYNSDLSLVSRSKKDALIEDPKAVYKHLLAMIVDQKVELPSGESVKIKADTFCIHGDTPSAIQILMYLSKKLPTNHIYLTK